MSGLSIQQVSLDKRLTGISLQVQPAELLHLIGPNGAGKSSLLQVLAGLLPVSSGQIRYAGRNWADFSLAELANFRTLQEQSEYPAFAVKVREALQFFIPDLATIPEPLDNALEIAPFLDKSMQQLSGGELRRVQISRALLQVWPAILAGEGLILLDEPLQGLDLRHQSLLMQLLADIADKGNKVVISNHDLNLCYRYADKVGLLKSGQLQEFGQTSAVMQPEALSNAFGCLIAIHTTLEGKKIFQTVEKDR
ncbi:ATP-binding cassette domain-containing protein [Neptunicella sp. SCSIO 80796]|uniref:ATP-binding cassette domain-containing protein n=1 Tax=Neptunicella plasticusilytica TaxID=3117012 RepID=UPI003A4E54A7